MWNGMFSPDLTKRGGCEHGNVAVFFGEPEFGMVEVYVQFNHTCSGNPVPSNDTTYTFEIELSELSQEGMFGEVNDIANDLDDMTDSERLKWVNENLTS